MKSFLFFVMGIVVGGLAFHFYYQQPTPNAPAVTYPPPTPDSPSAEPTLADKARQTAIEARDSVSAKLREWNLTPDEIRRDLAETGRIVRSKTRVAGERIDDARIVTVIKAKYVLDRDLSALAITVNCRDGQVTLTGTVDSPDLIGRAVALALDTDGVNHVEADLTAN